MTRGYAELYTPNGWVEIELADPGSTDYDPIEVYTPSGWATLALADPADADTPLEVYTQSRGWQGIRTVAFKTLDGWETYTAGDPAGGWNRPNWYVRSGSRALEGSQYYEMNGESTSGSPSRFTGTTLPGDGAPGYLPDPPYDGSETPYTIKGAFYQPGGVFEISPQWLCASRDYEDYRYFFDVDDSNNEIGIYTKFPDGSSNRLGPAVSANIPNDQWVPWEITQYGPNASPAGRFTLDILGHTLDSADEGSHYDMTSESNCTGGYGCSISSGDQAFLDHWRWIP